MIVADSSFLYALADRGDGAHVAASTWYAEDRDELTTTPLVLAEVDHLVAARRNRTALSAVRQDFAAGAVRVEWWPSATAESVGIAEQYSDLGVSLTDGSLVALAARLETSVIATFDERHFRAIRPLAGPNAFVLLPADAR